MTTTEIAPDVPADPDPASPEPARGGWGLGIVLIAISVVALLVTGVLVVRLLNPDPGVEGRTATFVVPAGTAAKVEQGAKVEIMPRVVRLDVGDSLVIRNDDDQTALVGPYIVKAGTTLTQTFRRPQYLVGECSLSGSGEIKIIVT